MVAVQRTGVKTGEVYYYIVYSLIKEGKVEEALAGLVVADDVVLGPDAPARTGQGALQFTAPDKAGKESLTGAALWFGPTGYDQVYFRRYIKFAADYDQGDLHHVGGSLMGVAGTDVGTIHLSTAPAAGAKTPLCPARGSGSGHPVFDSRWRAWREACSPQSRPWR